MEKNDVKIEKFLESVIYGRLSEVKLAIDEGINVNAFGRNGKTALMLAASHFRIPIVEILLNAGANPNLIQERDKIGIGEGKTAFMYAAENFFGTGKHSCIFKILKKAGANIDFQNTNGYTALMYAAEVGYLDAVKELVKIGVNLDLQNKDGNTALTIALFNSHSKIVKFLQNVGASEIGKNSVALINASRDNSVIEVKRLITTKVNLNHRYDGKTALCFAAISGSTKIVELLINAGADPNIRERRELDEGWTPLMYAVEQGHFDIVKNLIEAGADINAKVKAFSTEDSWKYTYLTVLEFCQNNYYQFPEILEFLEKVEKAS